MEQTFKTAEELLKELSTKINKFNEDDHDGSPDTLWNEILELASYKLKPVVTPEYKSAKELDPKEYLKTDSRFDLSDPMNHVKLRVLDVITLLRNYAEFASYRPVENQDFEKWFKKSFPDWAGQQLEINRIKQWISSRPSYNGKEETNFSINQYIVT